MAMTVADVEDFLRVLREHPEWRERVRQEVLGPEILALPELVAAVERQLAALTSEVAELRGAIMDLKLAIDVVDARLNQHDGRLANLDGRLYEQGYEALSRVGQRYRRAQRVYVGDIDKVMDARDDGRLDADEVARLGKADFIVRARDGKGPDAPVVYVVLEVSQTVHDRDVSRAAERAATLRSLGLRAEAWAGGSAISEGTAALARELGVRVEVDRPDDTGADAA
jgi:hypothetical protein